MAGVSAAPHPAPKPGACDQRRYATPYGATFSLLRVTADSADLVEAGRKLFAAPCTFIWAASEIDGLPPVGPPEIAFAGRSNVGKSSLLNALTGQNALARTSNTPGRTQQLNFFALGERLRLVDMPGYGYAAVSKQKVSAWTRLMHAFLRGRVPLMRVYLLIDARHGPKPADAEMMDILDGAAISYHAVLTKADETKPGLLAQTLAATLAALERRPAAFPDALVTSSRTAAGIPALRAAILATLQERGA